MDISYHLGLNVEATLRKPHCIEMRDFLQSNLGLLCRSKMCFKNTNEICFAFFVKKFLKPVSKLARGYSELVDHLA